MPNLQIGGKPQNIHDSWKKETNKSDGYEEPRKKPEAPLDSPVIWNIQPNKNTAQEGGRHNKKNIEYDCWAFTILIWQDKNVMVCSLKEFKLAQFPAGFANLFQQRSSHNLVENWGMVTGGGGLRIISWPVVAEQE